MNDHINLKQVLIGFIWGAIACLLITLLGSCRTIKYVPVETIKTEYITKTDTFVQRDSIHTRDSIYLHEWQQGDTIYRDRHHYHTIYQDRWRDRTHTDTIMKTDTIQVPYPVEKPLTRWEKFCIDYGKMGAGATAALAALLIISIARRVRRSK